MRDARRIYAITAIVLLGFAGITAFESSRDPDLPAPTFVLDTTGYPADAPGQLNLSAERGRVVLLDFMAVNCAACRQLTDQTLRPLDEAFGEELQIWSINVWAGQSGESIEHTVALQRSENVSWPHALDTDNVNGKYATYALPQLALIDMEGNLVWESRGLPGYAEVEAQVQRALEGELVSIGVAQVGIVALGAAAGVAALFAPCSIALVPAYLGILLERKQRPLQIALGVTLGMSLAYVGIAGLLLLFRDQLLPALPYLGPITGALLILIAITMLLGRGWERIAEKLGLGKIDGRRGSFAFGIGYGLASFSCTGPVLVPLLLRGIAEGPIIGLAVLGSYLLALASLLVLAALFVQDEPGRLRVLLSRSRAIQKITAVLFLFAGAYLLWFDLTAYDLI